MAPRGEATFDPEWVALGAGIKPALRLLGSARELEGVAARASRRGLAVQRAVLPGGGEILYLARDAGLARALRETEAPILPGLPPRPPEAPVREAHRELGRLLGFPPCCVDAFVERLARGVHQRRGGGVASEAFVAAEEALERTERARARLNFLLRRERRSLVPFDPCRFDCELGLRYAGALFAALCARSEREAEAIREALCRPLRLREGELELRLAFEAF